MLFYLLIIYLVLSMCPLVLVAVPKEDFMLPDDSPQVQAELNRRINLRAKAEGKVDEDPNVGTTTIIKTKGAKVAKPKAKKEKSAVAEGLDLASSGKWQQTHQQLAEARVLV